MQSLLYPIELDEKTPKQIYIPISYNDPHEHLPVLFRVLTGIGSSTYGPIGNAFINPNYYPYPYAYVYLDRIYHNKKFAKELGKSDLKLSEWAGKQVWDTFMHEFFHLYFNERFEKVDTYNYKLNKETGKMVQCNYTFTYSRVWEHNERIIGKLAAILTKIFFEDSDYQNYAECWYFCFTDYDRPSKLKEIEE